MKPINILVLSNLYPPNVVGGYERLCFEATAALAGRGHRMTVLTSSYGTQAATFPGQDVRRGLTLLTGAGIYDPFPGNAAARAAVNAGNLAVLRRTLDEVRPDVVFAWNLFFLDPSLLDALTGAVPTVLMLTDNWLLVMRNPSFVSKFFRRNVFGDEPLAAPRPPGIMARLLGRPRRQAGLSAIFGSGFMQALHAAGGVSFQREAVVHNGVRLASCDGASLRDRRTLAEPGTLRLLFAGRLVDLKGADVAVRALPLLDPSTLGVSRVVLTLVGDAQDAAYSSQLAAAVARSGRADDIVLRKAVPPEDLFALFQDHDIYIFPSLYEPFSLTLIEALACGIPTVASRTGGNVEIVEDGVSGLLSAKGDAADLARAVGRLAADPALRASLADGGRATAASFTISRMVDAMERALRPE